MAPHMDDASPNGDGASASRLTASASAPVIGGRRGVSIMIDPSAPMRDAIVDDTDTMVLNSAPGSPSAQKPGGRSAWASKSPAGSRPGSRQSAGPMGSNSRFSSCSMGSSAAHSTSGRFSTEELLCFKRVPTPSSSCDGKRDNYWDGGGAGETRRKLMEENWHTLPVLKGKFYSHPRLSDSISHLSSEKARSQKTHQKRQNQLRNQPAVDLPDEALTAALLDEIYPRTPTFAAQRERDFVSFDSSADGSPSTPSGDGGRKNFAKQRSNLGPASKRLSATDQRSLDTLQIEPGRSEPHPSRPPPEQISIHHASTSPVGMISPSLTTTNFASSVNMMTASGAMTPAGTRETLAASMRKETMLSFRKQIFEKYRTIKEGFDAFEREFPAGREMTKKEWRRVLVKLGFEATVEERDAIFDQLDFNQNGHVSMMEFHIAIEAAAPVRNMGDLRRRWLASGYSSMAQAFQVMEERLANEGGINKRLTLREFGELLSRVHVTDHYEHVGLFNAIVDQSETSRTAKVSIGELAAAIATVSPEASLEEIRWRIMKRYAGSVEKAFWDIDQDHSGIISRGEWRSRACFRMGLTESEATKIFDTIDFDHNGSVSMSEFLTAISMSEPSLFHEDLRKKIRQRFRSITDAFASAMDDFGNADLHLNPKLQFSRFEVLLKDMQLKHEELRTLFELIDANNDGALTVKEFLQGIRHFAPSCVLEDLTQICLQKYEFVSDAFAAIGADRNQLLTLEVFTKLLDDQGYTSGVDVSQVFALLDMRNEGVVTFGKLIAALQSGGAGSRLRQPSEERDHQAAQDIKTQMAPYLRFVGDHKSQVRQGLQTPEAGLTRQVSTDSGRGESQSSVEASQSLGGFTESTGPVAMKSPVGHRATPSHKHRPQRKSVSGCQIAFRAEAGQAWAQSPAKSSTKKASPPGSACANQKPQSSGTQEGQKPPATGSSSSNGGDAGTTEEEVIAQGNVAPRIRAPPQEELAKYMAKLDPSRVQEHKKFKEDPVAGSQQSWSRLWQYLHKSPDVKERFEMEGELLQYYQKNTKTVAHDVPLLERSHSRHAAVRSMRTHTKALAQNRTK